MWWLFHRLIVCHQAGGNSQIIIFNDMKFEVRSEHTMGKLQSHITERVVSKHSPNHY